MPGAPQSLLRFVQVRRVGPADAAPATCRAPAAIFDFSQSLPPAIAEAIQGGNRMRGAALLRELRDQLDGPALAAGKVALALARAVGTNERLTVGDLRARVAKLPREAGDAGPLSASKPVREVTQWASSIVTLRRWLRPDADVTRLEPARVLRGVVLIRLADSKVADGCPVRQLLRQQKLALPQVPKTAPHTPDTTPGTIPGTVPADPPHKLDRRAATQGAAAGVDIKGAANELDSVSDQMPAGAWPYLDNSVPMLSAHARVLGRGDLMIIRTSHLRYEPGDISHIENVLASEKRGRVQEVTTSTSETVTESSTSVSETSKELETTEHNSLERATQETSSATSSIAVGVSVSGGLGPVQAGIDIDAAHSTTTSESNSSAVSFARDVTEKATELLRSEEEFKRTTTTRTRISETNEHAFDNSIGASNIAGVYRWVDKVDQAQLYNYGECAMLEFVIPEPAAQHVAQASAGTLAQAPVPPAPFDMRPKDIGPANYAAKAAPYNAQGLEPPPPAELYVATTFVDPPAKPYDYPEDAKTTQPDWGYANYADQIDVPGGYRATKAYVTITWASSFYGENRDKKQDVEVSVGDDKIGPITDEDSTDVHEITIDHPGEGPVPVLVSTDQSRGLSVSVRILCERTDAGLEAWQVRMFEMIQQAYLDQQASYDSALRVQQSREAYVAMTPETVNRAIERSELKRGCQTVLTGQDFDLYGAVTFPQDDLPRIDRAEAEEEAKQIQFFEDCFRWQDITYLFYPYQWAGRPRWPDLLSRSSGDALHQEFLRAGAARVVVPVREGFEWAVGEYLATSDIPEWGARPWRGGTIGSPYPPIAELIADAMDRPGSEVAVGEPWEVVSPTSLIWLQPTGDLNPPDEVEPPS